MPGPAPAWARPGGRGARRPRKRSGPRPQGAAAAAARRTRRSARRRGRRDAEPIDGVAHRPTRLRWKAPFCSATTASCRSASGSIASIAVIGHNAREARTQGGGSATVIPERVISPLDAIRSALPDAHVSYDLGAVVQEGVAALPLEHMTNPRTGRAGTHLDIRRCRRQRAVQREPPIERARLVRRRRAGRHRRPSRSAHDVHARGDRQDPARVRRREPRAPVRGRCTRGRRQARDRGYRSRCRVPEPAVATTAGIEADRRGADRHPRRVRARRRRLAAGRRAQRDARHRSRRFRPGRPDRRGGRSCSGVGDRRRRGRHELEGRVGGLRPCRTSTCPASRTTSSAPSPPRTPARS